MKKYLRMILAVFVLLGLFLFMFTLYSCGSSKNSAMDKSSMPMAEAQNYDYLSEAEAEQGNYDYDLSMSADISNAVSEEWDEEGALEYSAGNTTAPGTAVSSQMPADRKIIRDAYLSLEADSVEEAYNALLANMSSLGGYESSRDMSGRDRSTYIDATIKIPAARLDEFLSTAKGVGRVLSSSITSSDITDQYFDSQTRLTTLEKTLAKYYEFLDGATRITDQLEISRQISEITYEIESLKGRMRKWDSLVEYSTVSIYIRCTPETYIEQREISWNSLSFDDVKYLAANGFVSISSAIVSAIQWLFIAIITLSPLIVPITIIIIVVVRINIKRRKERLRRRQVGIDKIDKIDKATAESKSDPEPESNNDGQQNGE